MALKKVDVVLLEEKCRNLPVQTPEREKHVPSPWFFRLYCVLELV